MPDQPRSGLHFTEYAAAARAHHPDMAPMFHTLLESIDGTDEDPPGRFCRPSQRLSPGNLAGVLSTLFYRVNPFKPLSRPRQHAGNSYRGLWHMKLPFDLLLYMDLIWQLQPKAIVELGSLQGASGLWLADQCAALAPGCEVHSFDSWRDCVSPRAEHPRLHFHQADLERLETVDEALVAALPHPWIVIDDAHANVKGVLRFFDRMMRAGDYYVIEDAPVMAPAAEAAAQAALAEELGYLVDTRYTDAFGYNMTSAPNGWLRKG